MSITLASIGREILLRLSGVAFVCEFLARRQRRKMLRPRPQPRAEDWELDFRHQHQISDEAALFALREFKECLAVAPTKLRVSDRWVDLVINRWGRRDPRVLLGTLSMILEDYARVKCPEESISSWPQTVGDYLKLVNDLLAKAQAPREDHRKRLFERFKYPLPEEE